MRDEFERRTTLNAECRVDAIDERRLRGYAIRFNSMSVNLGGFREVIKPEAVNRTISEALDVRALADHDTSKVLGRTRSGTLDLRKDKNGLAVIIEPDPEISYAKDIMRAVARGDISGMSFGFRVMPDGDEWDEDETGIVRYVTDMKISEVSIVSFPAYEETSVQVSQRSLTAFRAFQSQRASGRSLEWLRKVHKTRIARQA